MPTDEDIEKALEWAQGKRREVAIGQALASIRSPANPLDVSPMNPLGFGYATSSLSRLIAAKARNIALLRARDGGQP